MNLALHFTKLDIYIILGGGCKIILMCPLQGMCRVPIQDFFVKNFFLYLQKNPPPTTKKLIFRPDA